MPALLVLYLLSVGPAVWLLSNIAFPEWVEEGYNCLYCPLTLLADRSDFVAEILEGYAEFCCNSEGPPATNIHLSDPPPFLVEFLGTLIGAWLIWNFVRWLNQRKVAASG